MKSYKITTEEKVQIENKVRPDGSSYGIMEDINGDYFIWELEHQDCGFGVEAEFVAPEEEII